MTGTFDPSAFLDATVTGANSTEFVPVPEGEYTAVAGEPTFRQNTGRKDPSKTYTSMDIVWEIDDPALKETLKRDKVTVKQGMLLDLTSAGGIDMSEGKNVDLGRVRKALNLNDPKRAFSPRQITGGVARVKVSHRVADGVIYAEVKGVSPL